MTNTEKLHLEILSSIQKAAKTPQRSEESNTYHGSVHLYYRVNNPTLRTTAKKWAAEHKDIALSELISLLNILFAAPSYEEKTIAPKLLEYLPRLRSEIHPQLLDSWLNHLEGWAEIDSLCQSTFSTQDVLSNWPIWETLIKTFSKDKNISKRRASLVLLTAPVSHTDDVRVANLSFEIIEKLKQEKPILITKAISWLLRSMVRYHKQKVSEYVIMQKVTLPKIAVRETERKLKTGKK